MTKNLKRQYNNEYPSVTQVLDVLRKIGLENWFKMNTIAYINEKSSKGKLIGKQIHEGIESFIETGKANIQTDYDFEVTNALKSFMLFKKENPLINIRNSELMLTSEKYGFNGTTDCIADINGELIVIDWKSGEAKESDKPKIWDEWVYQCSAYVELYNEVNESNIKKAIIVAIAKDKVSYNLQEINEDEIKGCFNEVFLPALRILNYKKRKV